MWNYREKEIYSFSEISPKGLLFTASAFAGFPSGPGYLLFPNRGLLRFPARTFYFSDSIPGKFYGKGFSFRTRPGLSFTVLLFAKPEKRRD